jgi:spore maturation protein A
MWKYMVFISLLFGCACGHIEAMSSALIHGAENAVQLCIGLCGIYGLWCGLMKLAQKGGMLKGISKIISPLIKYLFPQSVNDPAAREAIIMNIAANLLGLGNAATPAGQKAIQEMARISKTDKATQDMVMLLAICNSSVTIVPTAVIALRAQAGSASPADIYAAELGASLIACAAAVVCVKWMYRDKNNGKIKNSSKSSAGF